MSQEFQLALRGGKNVTEAAIAEYQRVRARAATVGVSLADKERAHIEEKSAKLDELARQLDAKYYKSVAKEHTEMTNLNDRIEEYQFLARRQYKTMYQKIANDFSTPRPKRQEQIRQLNERYEAAVHPDDEYSSMIQGATSIGSLQNMVEQMLGGDFVGRPGSHGHALVVRDGTGMKPHRREFRW